MARRIAKFTTPGCARLWSRCSKPLAKMNSGRKGSLVIIPSFLYTLWNIFLLLKDIIVVNISGSNVFLVASKNRCYI